MMKNSLQVLLFSFLALFRIECAYAAPIEQRVVTTDSSVQFSVNSPVIKTTGQAQTYEAILLLDPSSVRPMSLEARLTPKDIKFGKLPIEQMLLVTGLMRSLPSREVVFRSDSIESQGGSNYLFRGVTDTGIRKEKSSFPLSFTKLSEKESILIGRFSHNDLFAKNRDPRFAILGDTSGSARIKLVFRQQ